VARTPDAVAVVFGDRTLTYAALDAQRNGWHIICKAWAWARNRGGAVRRAFARDADRALGHSQAGGAYLPIDAVIHANAWSSCWPTPV
jgi:non-ribosomal peptide synthetase component F